MATPFTAFRKYAGAAMAVLCGLLMVSFVVADPLMQMLGGGGNRIPSEAKDTVVVWNGGRLNEIELGEAVLHRRILAEFQQQVFTLGARDAQAAGVGDLAMRVRPLELPATVEQGVERDVVRTKIFAQRAREAGMVVSDEMIIDYLKGLGRDRVSSEQMRTIMGGMQAGAGRRATIGFVFSLLREAMLARNFLSSHLYVFDTVLPEERWDDWLKVNDRVVVEGAPVSAADYIDQVPEPSEAELEEFFEEYRERVPRPDILREYGAVQLESPLPAFATPERVQLQYVVAKFEDFTEKLMSEVTDEEVAEYYEENKDRFIEADRALFGDDDLFGDGENEEPAADSEAAEMEATEEENPTDESDAAEAVAEEEEEEEVADGADTEESPSPDGVNDGADASENSGSAEASAEDEGIDTTLTYQPLEEVSEEIRRRLAEVKAGEAMRELMTRLKNELDDAYAGYFDAVLDATDAEAEAPAPPAELSDLSQLAQENGLSREQTEPLSVIQLIETTHGSSINLDPTAPQPLPLWHISFTEGAIDRYEPLLTFDSENNLYLSVISERLEQVTPELDDVREEVIAAWKRDKAADLALDAAREIADKVSESGLSIEGYVGENPDAATGSGAFETDPMSFLTVAGVNERSGQVVLRLSQPQPLIEPGPDLMKSIFSLEAGEVGAALNHDRTVAYVLRLAARLTPEDQLRSQFLVEGGQWYGALPLARVRQFRTSSAVFESVLGEADLDWVRDPDQPR